jgi:hypothetical protein
MRYDYVFYTTEELLEDLPHYSHHFYNIRADLDHGFCIEIDNDDNVNVNTIWGYNDFSEMNSINSLEELKKYLEKHYDTVDTVERKECLEELIGFITCQLQKEVA